MAWGMTTSSSRLPSGELSLFAAQTKRIDTNLAGQACQLQAVWSPLLWRSSALQGDLPPVRSAAGLSAARTPEVGVSSATCHVAGLITSAPRRGLVRNREGSLLPAGRRAAYRDFAAPRVLLPARATTTAPWSILAWPGLVDVQRSIAHASTIEIGDGLPGSGIVRHVDETKTFASTRVAIYDDNSVANLPVGGEEMSQILIRRVVRQVSHVDANCHCSVFSLFPKGRGAQVAHTRRVRRGFVVGTGRRAANV